VPVYEDRPPAGSDGPSSTQAPFADPDRIIGRRLLQGRPAPHAHFRAVTLALGGPN